jgi:hypothetical protein
VTIWQQLEEMDGVDAPEGYIRIGYVVEDAESVFDRLGQEAVHARLCYWPKSWPRQRLKPVEKFRPDLFLVAPTKCWLSCPLPWFSRTIRYGNAAGACTDAIIRRDKCQLLFSAGHQTLIDQLCNGVHALLSHPEQLRELQDDPSRIGSAVEEVLRYDPSLSFMNRVASADLEVGGQVIRQGQLVRLGIAAGNRDPEMFADLERFDIRRVGKPHVSFATGAHACLGMGLARLELKVALMSLFWRFPYLRLDPENLPRRRCETLFFRGFHALPTALSGPDGEDGPAANPDSVPADTR